MLHTLRFHFYYLLQTSNQIMTSPLSEQIPIVILEHGMLLLKHLIYLLNIPR